MPTLPGLKMLPGMMPILHSPAVITPGQFGPTRRDLEPREGALHLHHVGDRNAFGDADDQLDLGIDRLRDRIGSAGRRHVDHARVAPVFSFASATVSNTGRPRWVGRLARRGAADHLRAVVDRPANGRCRSCR